MTKFSYGLACSAFLLTSLASATVITPGTSGGVPSVFSNAGWTQLATTGPQSLNSGTFSATATAWVYSDTNNSFCSGCLDFVYDVTRTGGSDPIERITGGTFAGFGTDVGYITGAGVVPGSVSRSGGAGNVVGFNFLGTNIEGSDSSVLLVIQTDAKTYVPGTMAVIDSASANALGFQPASAVPEPVSMTLVGGGLAVLGLLRFRRKR